MGPPGAGDLLSSQPAFLSWSMNLCLQIYPPCAPDALVSSRAGKLDRTHFLPTIWMREWVSGRSTFALKHAVAAFGTRGPKRVWEVVLLKSLQYL